MEITRDRPPTTAAPGEYFTGQVWVDTIATPPAPSRLRAVSVHFAPGARTAWHTHPVGQVLHVTAGTAWVQRRGGPVEVLRTGETVAFAPGEEHWHGAAPGAFMTHLALHETDGDGRHVDWGPLVTDAEYAAGPA